MPGRREELVTALIRTLPKTLRRHFVPAPDRFAAAVLERVRPGEEPLLSAVPRALRAITGVTVPADAWQLDRLPPHLRPTFRVVDEAGAEVARGKELAALRRRHAAQTRAAVAAVADGVERRGVTSFTGPDGIGTLPRTREQRPGGTVTAHLALVDRGDAVDVRVFDSPLEARDAMRAGTRRLLRLALSSPAKSLVRSLDNTAVLRLRGAMATGGYRDVAALAEDCVDAAVDALVATGGGPAWDPEAFETLRAHVAARLPAAAAEVLSRAESVLGEAGPVELAIDQLGARSVGHALDDVREQLRTLVGDRFVHVRRWRACPTSCAICGPRAGASRSSRPRRGGTPRPPRRSTAPRRPTARSGPGPPPSRAPSTATPTTRSAGCSRSCG